VEPVELIVPGADFVSAAIVLEEIKIVNRLSCQIAICRKAG
jgi:hypothetical protein